MRHALTIAILTSLYSIGLSSMSCSAEPENPFHNAKIGDWTEYKMTGPNVAGTTKMVITAKDDKEVTYEVTSTFKAFGQETTAPAQKIKVDLTKSYDPDVAANLKNNNTKVEKLGEGSEKIKVGAKEFETKWTKQRATTEVANMKIVTETKMWMSKDVPISGMVKMESTTSGTGGPDTTTTVELVDSGSK